MSRLFSILTFLWFFGMSHLFSILTCFRIFTIFPECWRFSGIFRTQWADDHAQDRISRFLQIHVVLMWCHIVFHEMVWGFIWFHLVFMRFYLVFVRFYMVFIWLYLVFMWHLYGSHLIFTWFLFDFEIILITLVILIIILIIILTIIIIIILEVGPHFSNVPSFFNINVFQIFWNVLSFFNINMVPDF